MTRSRRSSLILSFVLAAFTAQFAVADGKPLLRLHAFAVNLSGPAPARTGTLDVTIERWSTPAEAARLRDVLAEKGADALLETLQKMPRAGSIQRTGQLGWDIHFAQQVVASNGSRRIVLATDRPMSFWEAANQPRSADYAFTLAEIRLGPDGKGEGKLVPAAKIDYDKESNTLEIENYNTEPTRLTQVVAEK
ncbi:MAG: hypothetical protein DMF77_03480 [Acidobacteria bacterium]|nr:MAG: hypothetical protein DMF77_03480 [Acidobacteriota bacterium]